MKYITHPLTVFVFYLIFIPPNQMFSNFAATVWVRRVMRETDLSSEVVEEYNQQSKPFAWTADPNKIVAAVKRGHQVLDSIH